MTRVGGRGLPPLTVTTHFPLLSSSQLAHQWRRELPAPVAWKTGRRSRGLATVPAESLLCTLTKLVSPHLGSQNLSASARGGLFAVIFTK